tara:strand:- start:627 stop:1379 length:753 start_codon:yes stop_codon:yes gene_type:complete
MLKKILLIALISAIALFAAVYLFGSKILNAALKQVIQSGAPLVTQCEVAIDQLELSLFSGEGQVRGFELKNPTGFSEQNLFALDQISVSVDPESLLSQEIHIHSIVIDQPKFCFEQAMSGSNWQKLIQNLQAFSANSANTQQPSSNAESSNADTPMPKIRIDSLSIQEAQVALSLLGVEKVLELPSIHITDLNPQGQALDAHELLIQVSERILQEITKLSLPTNLKGSDIKSLVPANALKGLRQAIEGAL